jgi:hypothetical protein
MDKDLAAANVNRSYQLMAISIAIFTFMLGFLYPRYASGEVNGLLFQSVCVVMGLATFSFLFAALCFYGTTLQDRFDQESRATFGRIGNLFWLAGTTMLLLAPGVVLLTVGLWLVAGLWLVLWLSFVLFMIRFFPHVVAKGKQSA